MLVSRACLLDLSEKDLLFCALQNLPRNAVRLDQRAEPVSVHIQGFILVRMGQEFVVRFGIHQVPIGINAVLSEGRRAGDFRIEQLRV